MIEYLIISVIITGGAAYLIYSSFEYGMLNDWWIVFWAKVVLKYKKIDYNGISDKDCIEIAKIYKIMKPLGTCIKCFGFWFCLVPSFIFSCSVTTFLFIFIASTILSIWLAVTLSNN